jgi:hypothetical protein
MEQPQDRERLKSIQQVVGHIICVNAIGLHTVMYNRMALPRVTDEPVWEEYEQLFKKEQISIGEYGKALYEPRMQSIVEYIDSLTLDETAAFIKDLRPSEFYGRILRVLVMKLDISTREYKTAENDPDVEIPTWYSHLLNKPELLAELSFNLETDRHRLIILLNAIKLLLLSIQQAAKSAHLTGEHLEALKIQVEAFQSYYSFAHSRAYDNAPEQQLMNPHAERWW